jgi:hypothetical protein
VPDQLPEPEDEAAIDEVADEALEFGAEEPSREVDPRRGRRFRGRRDRRRRSESEPAAEEQAEEISFGKPRPQRPLDEPEEEFGPRESVDIEEEEVLGPSEMRPAHRAIPTWDDAIGVIIRANMENRGRRSEGGGNRGRDRR